MTTDPRALVILIAKLIAIGAAVVFGARVLDRLKIGLPV